MTALRAGKKEEKFKKREWKLKFGDRENEISNLDSFSGSRQCGTYLWNTQ